MAVEFNRLSEALKSVESFDLPARLDNVTVVAASMFAGKSEELIACALHAEKEGRKVQAFTSSIDNRRGRDSINTYSGQRYPAKSLGTATEIFQHLEEDTEVIVIDEGQFLGSDLVAVSYGLGRAGKRVVVGGLNADFRGVPFHSMASLMLSAEVVSTPKARCEVCDSPATRTQRLKAGEDGVLHPADFSDPIIVVGDKAEQDGKQKRSDVYEPRCVEHHEVPNPKKLDFNPEHVRVFMGLDGGDSRVKNFPAHEMWRHVEILLRAPTALSPEDLTILRENIKPYLATLE